MKQVITFIAILLLSEANAQGLSPDAFIQQVLKNHPDAQNADLVIDRARKQMTSARGGFDPVLYGSAGAKAFESTSYFDMREGGVKLPTRLGGLELKAAYQINEGARVNPENYTPSDGLVIAGVALPVGKGLFTDQERTRLRQAGNDRKSAPFERNLLLMNLVLEAQKTYWEWVFTEQALKIFSEAVALSDFRFRSVKQGYETGDLAAVDTLEAFIQLQLRQTQLREAQIEFYNSSYGLNNFLWKDKTQNQEPDTTLRPAFSWEESLTWAAETLNPVETHPAVVAYQYKIQNLDLERKLKIESIKPELNLHYNFLSSPNDPFNDRFDPMLVDNYKYGVTAKFPLFMRQGIGDVGLANVKLQGAGFDLTQKQRELQNKQRSSLLNVSLIKEQLVLLEENALNYRRLLEAERQKFDNGESSLFIVNSRESKLIEAELKLAKMRSMFMKEKASFQWANGTLVTP